MEGLKVRCHTCGLVLYETTNKYTCHKPLTGDMLRLLSPCKDWPTYDGSLAVSSTPRFLMFCSQCAGYIANSVGGLRFADFEEGPRVVSQERSEMGYEEDKKPLPPWKRKEDSEYDKETSCVITEAIDNFILPNAEDKALSVDPPKAETTTVFPEDLLKEIEKQGNTPRPGRSKKKGKRK